MVINLKFKHVITAAMLSGFVSFVSFAQESDRLAPEVTAAEANISFWDLPYLKEAFIDTTPADRKDGLAVGDWEANGGNKAMILQLSQEISDQKHGKYDSLLIARHGKLIFESYYLRGRADLPHFQASATKSHVSMIVGRAMQLGYLTMADLDKPLVDFLKGMDPTKFVGGVEKITLHKAMTMSSGLRFSEEQFKVLRKDNGNQVQTFFEISTPITSDSQSYHYQSPDPIMVMQVLDTVVPGSAKDFIKNELFDKLGSNVYSWPNDLSDLPKADEYAHITSRDMVKLGTLVTHKGQWNGEQLISPKYLANATRKMTKVSEDWQPDGFNYGYFWYQTDISVKDKSFDAKIAWGNGGQHIIAITELDIVIVVTGHGREDTIMTQVSKIILPALVK
ncbi:MAG: CubicO group peptidase (beta-lactamase class C family) [Paraglaciecola sp.]|jgi:CubicO group peptidase (beta-lactamase class C family)